jgi:hypothetical protein
MTVRSIEPTKELFKRQILVFLALPSGCEGDQMFLSMV